MFVKLMEAVFAPKFPRHYRGRHRAPLRETGSVAGLASAGAEPEAS